MTLKTLLAALLVVSFSGTAAQSANDPMPVMKQILSDPLWLKYYDINNKSRPSAHPGTAKFVGMKPELSKWIYAIKGKCNVNLHQCRYGWDLFLGKGTDALKQWIVDTMEFAKWDDLVRGNTIVEYGGRWASKISNDPNVLPRSAIALAMWEHKGAADLIAKTIAKPGKQTDDLYRSCDIQYALRGLWLQGADGKKHLDTFLNALKHKSQAYNCKRKQVSWMLPHLDSWTLSADQVKGMEAFCTETIWQEDVGDIRPRLACIRYMGNINSKNSDVHEFVRNFAEGNDNSLRAEGIRIAGKLGIKATKTFLKKRLAKAYSERSERVKKGKKYVKKTVDTWNNNFDAVSSAVALMGMGDKEAVKAIDYWLSYRPLGKTGKMAFMWNQGFKEVARDLAFSHPKIRKKLVGMVSKAFKTGLKHADKNDDLHRDLFSIAIGLSHVGDKGALNYLMEVLGASDKNQIKELVYAWGGAPSKMLELGRSTVGLGRFPVGKGGYSAKDAQKVIDIIKKRMKFWNDSSLKQYAIDSALTIQAHIDAEKL